MQIPTMLPVPPNYPPPQWLLVERDRHQLQSQRVQKWWRWRMQWRLQRQRKAAEAAAAAAAPVAVAEAAATEEDANDMVEEALEPLDVETEEDSE